MPIIDTSLQKESRDRYLTYALSVVSSRALPDVRDGLKPVQRRILYAMLQQLNLRPSGTHRKCAAVVGEVLARFHPHGDIPCYEALARMAQDFSLRYPLIDGQGNFGSLDGDAPAAYRYTEARLREIALDVLGEITEETVPFRDNFDATMDEPVVFPSRVPNLLINGASGIAVGMATSIPPHNLRDVVKALIELSNDPDISPGRLATLIKAPDFPTGGLILNTAAELSEIYKTGRGSIRMRAEWEPGEERRGKKSVIITSIPYGINKSQLVEKIATLIVNRKVPQLVDVRDESTSDVRIVLEVAPGADPERAMAYLYKNTPLESNFAVNLTALVPTREGACKPQLLSLKECLQFFLDFREEVVRKRLLFEKKNLADRIHILEGLAKIFDALDEALKIIRKSEGRSDAAHKLIARFKLTETQAFAVVDMRVYQLSRTSIEEVRRELAEHETRMRQIDKLLKSRTALADIVRSELGEMADKYGDKRRCKLVKDREDIELEYREEDYVVHEDVYAIVTADGWLKRIRQTNELSSTRLREGDTILHAFPLSTKDSVVFFTNLGFLFVLKVADFPASSGYGDPIQKILKFKDGERVVECFGVRSETNRQLEGLPAAPFFLTPAGKLVLATRRGLGFVTETGPLEGVKRNGKRLVKVRPGDELAAVALRDKKVALVTRGALGLAIDAKEIPERGAGAQGVILMGLHADDELAGAVCYAGPQAKILVRLAAGGEKQISASELAAGHRGLKGKKILRQGEVKSVSRL